MALPEPKTKEWFLLNAVCMWLKAYPDHEWTEEYEELKNELSNTPTVRKRGRPAKRQRKKETSSPASSKEETQTT